MAPSGKNYWLYDLRVLFKNRVTFWSLLYLTPIVGFLIPKDLYELINRGNISGLLPSFWLTLASVILILINIFIIRVILLTKYAVKRQSNLAGPTIYLVIAVFAFTGIWLRLYLEYIIPETSTLLSATTPAPVPAPTPAPPHLPLSFWPAVVSVAITLSLFSTVYGLVSEPYSKVDYSAFQSSFEKIFVRVKERRDKKNKASSTDEEYAANIKDLIKETIKLLQSETDKEKDYYLEFVNNALFPPLRKLEELVSMQEFKDTPDLILELDRSDNKTDPSWIKDEGYMASFRTLQSYLDRSLK